MEDWSSVICLDCHIVLEESLLMPETNYITSSMLDEICKPEEQDLLLTIRDFWFLNEQIIQDTKYFFSQVQKKVQDKFNFSRKQLLAYALYNTLIKHECTREPNEVLEMFQIKKKNVLIKI